MKGEIVLLLQHSMQFVNHKTFAIFVLNALEMSALSAQSLLFRCISLHQHLLLLLLCLLIIYILTKTQYKCRTTVLESLLLVVDNLIKVWVRWGHESQQV